LDIKPKNILFIHQSTDLYGSDKALLFLVKELDKNFFNPIVVLPNHGLLNGEFENLQIKTIVTPIINIYKGMFTIKKIVKLPFQIIKSIKKINNELNDLKIDIVHSNTVVVCLGVIYAKRYGIKHFWHIHEIIKNPKIVARFFSYITYYFSDKVIFNSKATQKSFLKYKPQLEKKSIVIYNGINRSEKISSREEIKALKRSLKINDNDILFGLFGRINENKGHELLMTVFNRLYKNVKNIKLLIIGSTIEGKEELLRNLKNKLVEYKLNECVTILPFQRDIWKFWDVIDVAVVPSKIPESFGLVALEAMLSKKTVIASNEGGLAEIVVDKKTGILFNSNDEDDLESAMLFFINNRNLINSYGEEGYFEALKRFTLKAYVKNFEMIYYK